jgi:hypothetical protein
MCVRCCSPGRIRFTSLVGCIKDIAKLPAKKKKKKDIAKPLNTRVSHWRSLVQVKLCHGPPSLRAKFVLPMPHA